MNPLLAVALALLALPALADEAPLRPSARLLFKHPELLRPGTCAAYREGGAGWIVTDPVYYLQGEVVGAEVRTRHLGRCPEVPGKTIDHYNREEFVHHLLAYPCVGPQTAERNEQVGIVRLRVTDWETPHAKLAANGGRLYRGYFIDRKLEKGLEIELEADLLGVCEQ